MEELEILLPAFVVCLLMLATHPYFGLHVLSRGIIFVDLALAQIAALGISIAFLLGEETHGYAAQVYAFSATLLASFMFAKLRHVKNRVVREVTIGCVYVVATALSIVILSRSAQGMEELKSILNGNILWVSWEEVGLLFVFYFAVMLLHGVYRNKFYSLSFKGKDEQPGFFWEFLFFASFSVVITLAVNLTGILLVFAFLIIPAFSASLLKEGLKSQLLNSWLLGLVGCSIGLATAFQFDLPVGATIVSSLGVLPIFAALLLSLRKNKSSLQ